MVVPQTDRHSGFTLIEVMVALFIVAIALPVFLKSMHGLLDNTSHMRDKTHAYWLAENKMQEMMLEHEIKGDVTKTRKREDQEEFAGREWYWKVEMERTAVEQMYRMEISVGLEQDESLASLSGFLREHESTQQ